MDIFIILPYSNSDNRLNGVRYVKAKRIKDCNGYKIGYFEESLIDNPQDFYCKTLNELYQVGNIMIEKCTYDITGNPIKK